ncbi:hypothetical protein Mal52_11180 [Symmachiella dynata]|uniref:Transposase IS4-like domain-containing protein n=1 Tax=Symmachiella dynata TaxID=2527995 RepID=A0A517ZJK2_9PLAN|nr:transposase [Symmachiella dynata]QDU42451.1 hypothetical protein Mal52_09120 [Symmachiella dynata]QDU42651.1 hypothetical protein Mal52_11180 [Symmachiella dynata]
MSNPHQPNVLLEVASLSMRLSTKFVQPYSHPKSPQKFTQSQLLTILILKAYLKTTYRGIIDILGASDQLRERMELTRLPHYSTLKYFADRSHVLEITDAMLAEIIKEFAADADEASMDSTGLETSSASAHFRVRSGKTRKKYVKLSVCVVAGSMLPAGLVVGWGPGNDKCEAPELLEKVRHVTQPKRLFADAGYDAEWIHMYCREGWGVQSWIPPAVHRADGSVGGEYRQQMTKQRLKKNGYGRRWLVESFMSGLKRTMGSALAARSESSLIIEAGLKVLAYALRR